MSSGLIVLGVLGFIGYRLSRRGHRRARHSWWASAKRDATAPASAPPLTWAQARGDAGEVTVRAELHRVLGWLCGGNYYLHDSPVLLNIAPGAEFPTAEVDHLAVTPFGIFVIETKNWSGTLTPGESAEAIVRIASDGTRETRRSPLAQNRSKVAFLDAKLPRVWPVFGLGVFAASDSVIHPDLPSTLIHVSELAHFMRLRRQQFLASGATVVNIKTAWAAMMLHASIDPADLEQHLQRIRVNPKVCAGHAD
ncbi:nuclease-related domain-containing protein [Paraburkholderia unamae]|uniref:Nuclease-like protein n=1 Tax=Paraburkholderia unamae TaxID=219649 RepID=A0ABX5KV19_9BURK|nr:nuclease-related domain-containing protein [Paraburkholderia unamae]PVX85816.1 nuclease-like protein [Paraburkholderia unamae]